MTDAPHILQPLRTWSHLAGNKRKPTEYEVVSVKLHYHTMNPDAAWELDPDVFMNRWYREHREGSALKHPDWDAFRDPDQTVYRTYIAKQDDQETYVTAMLDEHDRLDHDAKLSADWLDTLARWYTPSRYPAHLLQMASAYVGQMAPASTITTPCYFQAADSMRMVQHTAYRTRELANRYPALAFASGERAAWETDPIWQGFRELLERLLVTWDWAEAFTVLNLVVTPAYQQAVLHELSNVADSHGDRVLRYLSDSQLADGARNRRWVTALVDFASTEPGNADVLSGWVAEWQPLADAALHAYLDPLSAGAADAIASCRSWHASIGLA